MKKFLSFILLSSLLCQSLSSCTYYSAPPMETISSSVTLTSSDTEKYGAWLTERLGEIRGKVILGIGDCEKYGIDMSSFEDDGYIIRSLGDETVIFGKTDDGLDRACRRYANDIEITGAVTDKTYHEGYRIEELRLFGTPISEFAIAYPADKSENILLAVTELQRLVKTACGISIPASKSDSVSEHTIIFRFSDDTSLRNDGFRYYENNGNLIFESADESGLTNAVYGFLENECGWSGLAYGNPELKESVLTDVPLGIDKTVIPAFDFISCDTERNTLTSQSSHSFADTSYDASKSICYTDDSTYDKLLSDIKEYIEKKTDEGLVPGISLKEINIPQTNNDQYCLCDSCGEVLREEGSTAGTLVLFANRLSEELNEEYPGIVCRIFADDDASVPLNTSPNEYVYVTYSYEGCCLNHPLSGTDCTAVVMESGQNNSHFAEKLSGWMGLTDNVYVMLDLSAHPLQQYTVLDILRTSLGFFYESGVKGIYCDGPTYNFGLQHIEAQLMHLLNRNIHMSDEEYEEHLCSLLEKEYGDGWKYIREYVTLWNNIQDLTDCWDCNGISYNTDIYAEYFDDMVFLLEKAVSLTGSSLQQKKCELLSCHMYYKGCLSSYFETYYSGDRVRITTLDDMYSKMVSILAKYGFDITSLTSADGTLLMLSDNLYDAAWRDWAQLHDVLYSGEIPDYTDTDALMEFCESVNEHTADDRLTFGFRSDTHYSSDFNKSKKENLILGIESKLRMNRYIDLAFMAHGGDIINGNQSTKELALQSLSESMSIMRGVHSGTTNIFLRGNHDDNSWYGYAQNGGQRYYSFPTDTVVTSNDWRDYAFAEDSENIVTDETGAYGYFDHEESKIRVLLIDTSDLPYEKIENGVHKYGAYAGHAIRQDQLQFMADAMTFKDKGDDGENWAILVLSHVPIETLRVSTSKYRFGLLDATGRNFFAFLRLLKAYQRGTVFKEKRTTPTNYGDGGYSSAVSGWNDDPELFAYDVYADFSKNGPGEVIGMISGHTHIDNFSDEVGMVSYNGGGNIYPKLSWGYPYFTVGTSGVTVFTVERNGDDTGFIYVNHLGISGVPRQDMIAEGDNAVATTDPIACGSVSSTPYSGSIASGEYTVAYSQNR